MARSRERTKRGRRLPPDTPVSHVPEPPPAGGDEPNEQQEEYVLEEEPDGRYRIVAKRPRAKKPEH